MSDFAVVSALSLGIGLTVLIIGIFTVRLISERITNQRTRRVVQSYAPSFTKAQEDSDAKGKPSRISGLLENLYASTSQLLEKGNIPIQPKQWLGLQVLLFFAATLIFGALSGNFPISILVAGVLTALIPRFLIKSRYKKRLVSFETELPETLMLVASALRSGLSFQQALEATVSDRDSELGIQMRLAINESKLGPPLEESLNRVADRMESEDLRWLVAALEIQREVGGTLSTILDTAAATIKGREELRREVRSLSAEGRLSAYVLIGLPVIIFLVLFVSRPNYVEIFWTELIGVVMLVAILVMIAIGWVWMNKMIQIKV